MHFDKKFYSLFLIVFLMTACGSPRNITYLSNLGVSEESKTIVQRQPDRIIRPDDILSITVASLSIESNVLFNSNNMNMAANSEGSDLPVGYLVDENGFIDFPVIGAVKLMGLTRDQAKEKLVEKLNEHVKKPIVNIRFLNFTVTVLGEVTRPSSFNIATDDINIFEALGYAGDMTVYGKRENVLLIREKEDVRTTVKLDLNDKEILKSPYFYLEPNDILYVEADRAKLSQANVRRTNFQFALSTALALTSIATLIVTILR